MIATAGPCLNKFYIMAFTSGIVNGGSDEHHAVVIRAGGHCRHQLLHNLPGDDFSSLEGDFWKYTISSFGFPSTCITIDDVSEISIIEHNNDGWNIDSIATFFIDENGASYPASIDLDANRWVDGDDTQVKKRFELTLII